MERRNVDKIDKRLSNMETILIRMEANWTTLNERGCAIGLDKVEELSKEVYTKIDSVDEKHDRRTIGAMGAAILALAGAIGTIIWSVLTKGQVAS